MTYNTEDQQLRHLLIEWDQLVSTLQGAREIRPHNSAVSVGVTVLTGFLGAGKTTLLRHLLHGEHGLKLAAIVNDVGAINIDAALIKKTNSGVTELTNGCSCCTLGAEFGRTIDNLANKSNPPDEIIIEASGIADPVNLATIVATNSNVELGGVVSVVDVTAMGDWLGNPLTKPLFQRQLDAAHLLVLNKIDLVGAEEKTIATSRLGILAPGRPVIGAEQGRVAADVVLSAALRGGRAPPSFIAHDVSVFATKTFSFNTPINQDRLAAFLDNPPNGLLRVKGFVDTTEAPGHLYLVQAVGRMWSIDPIEAVPNVNKRTNVIVLIGLANQVTVWGEEVDFT